MMNGSVYRIKYFGCKFRTSLFTLHCPQFRSALIFWVFIISDLDLLQCTWTKNSWNYIKMDKKLIYFDTEIQVYKVLLKQEI